MPSPLADVLGRRRVQMQYQTLHIHESAEHPHAQMMCATSHMNRMAACNYANQVAAACMDGSHDLTRQDMTRHTHVLVQSISHTQLHHQLACRRSSRRTRAAFGRAVGLEVTSVGHPVLEAPMCVYTYIYIYICICIYMYIYIYTHMYMFIVTINYILRHAWRHACNSSG